MNLQQLRKVTRRLIMEETADQWADIEINEMLNVCTQNCQTRVMEVDPEAFNTWATINVAASERYYPLPVDALYEVEVGYSANPATEDYVPLDKNNDSELRRPTLVRAEAQGAVSTDRTAATYSRSGRYLYLGWKPSALVTNGLQVKYVRALEMEVDTDYPGLVLPLHYAVALEAAMNLGLESAEANEAMLIKIEKHYWAKIPMWYRKSAGGNTYLPYDLGKDRW